MLRHNACDLVKAHRHQLLVLVVGTVRNHLHCYPDPPSALAPTSIPVFLLLSLLHHSPPVV